MSGFVRAFMEWLWPTKPTVPTEPEPTESTEPWREASNCNKEHCEVLLNELHRLQQDTKQNILILGPTGAGKSSFINSVMSIDKGRKYGMSVSGDRVFGSWTRDLAAYSGRRLLMGCRLFDCMGIEHTKTDGILLDDLMFLIKGHIKKGYKFNPDKPINKRNPCYRSEPTFADQMHCVIFVLSAPSVRDYHPNGRKIRELQLKLRDENIPRIMILTHVDLICNEVRTDETKMFKSREVHETVNLASEQFGIEKASIHPVVNYVGDFNIRPERNVPILLALRQAMHYSEDRVDYVEHENSDDGESVVKQKTCSTTECDPPGVFEVMAENYIFNLKIVDWKFPQEWCKTNADPYIKIAFTKAPDAVCEASVSKSDFQFSLKEDEGNEMEISLIKGKEKKGEIISTQMIPLLSFKLLEKEKQEQTICMDKVPYMKDQKDVTIKVVMSAKVDTQLMLGHGLCDAENDYIRERQTFCLKTMEEILKDNAPSGKNLVPRLAVMGSGGGFRAMTAFSGVMSALVRSKIADMVMYNVGLSGSAWYLSTLYSHPDWPQEKSALDLRSELRKCIVSDLTGLFRILRKTLNPFGLRRDYLKCQTFTLTNFYGRFIGLKLLQKRKDSTLTYQQGKVSKGLAPLPLYAALNVKPTTSAKVFHEWIEFSPFAIGMPKYGTFLRPNMFGSEFFSGRLLKEFDEFPLHFLLGIWGSAYCILLHRFIQIKQSDFSTWIMNLPILNNIKRRAAEVNNFMRGLQLQEYRPYTQIEMDGYLFSTPESTEGLFKDLHEMNPTDAEKMFLVDAGLAFNSPFPLILRPEREIDLILSFDFSERENDKADPFTQLRLAAEWAKLHKRPFPDIKTPEIGSEELKECYVFENPDDLTCPIVIHFVLINNEFRKFKTPGVPRMTKEDKEFGEFNVFDGSKSPYSTFNFTYTDREFDRLADLMEFNTLINEETILNNIRKCVVKRKQRVMEMLPRCK